MLTPNEQESVTRATQLLERTAYDTEQTSGRVADARAVASALLELANAVDAERSARIAAQEKAERIERLMLERNA